MNSTVIPGRLRTVADLPELGLPPTDQQHRRVLAVLTARDR
jgi:hypothetical protein